MINNYNFDYVDEPMLDITKYAASINCKSDKVLHIQKYENTIIDPLCVLSSNQLITDCTDINTSDYQIENNPVIFLGSWFNVWGHLLTDTLSKFWFVNSNNYLPDKLNECDILYSIEDNNLPSQFYELLDIIGIDKNRLKCIDKPKIYKTIYVPDDSIFLKHDKAFIGKDVDSKNGIFLYTKEYLNLINTIKNSNREPNNKKLFFSISSKTTKFIGINSINKIMKYSGFELINPIHESIKNQISLLSNCHTFCTFEGSISFNALFLNSNSEIVLLRKLTYIDPYQFMINEISNAKITYIDTHMSLFCDKNYPYLGPFLLYPSKNLYNYFKSKKKPNIPILLFIKYIFRSIKMQNERKSFITTVKWEIDMYYFDKLNEILRDNLFSKIVLKLINKSQSN